MNANDLTHHLIAELQRVAAANCETRCVLDAMSPHITDVVLSATVDQMSAIAAEEASIAEWLLDGQGQAPEGCAARPVEPVANAGWSATEQLDPQLRDIEIGTVATQLQSYHLAAWLGVAAFLRVLELQDEADVVDQLTTALRSLERELETLRPSLAQLAPNLNDSTEWYRPSNRRHYGNFATTTLRL